tara:strand:+ start:909 stop:1208 length:300 start_codon:yes stop_codon:yes gene_type:complete
MIEEPVERFLAILKDKNTGAEVRAKVETVLRRGLRILPVSRHVRGRIAEAYGIETDKMDHLDDDQVITMAFKRIDDPLVNEALLFQSGITQGIFDELFQ